MEARVEPDRHAPASRALEARHPGMPGWRPLLAACAVVAALAAVLHLLYW